MKNLEILLSKENKNLFKTIKYRNLQGERMELIIESSNLEEYLKLTNIIDFDKETIKIIGDSIAKCKKSDIEIVKEVYEYVRDNIKHSGDINAMEVTCKASEVLEKKHGICCAKAHLFAAILRYKGIPCGFCYQKLYSEDGGIPYVAIHGLNGVYLKSINKWIRLDARGNKEGVKAEFSIEAEKIAWPINKELGEEDLPIVYVNPNETIVQTLINSKTRTELHLYWKNEIQYIFDR